jgi:hypothetical protein
MSTVKVNTVDKRTGGTLTLGGCGTTVTLGAGATQSGFGRTGTVDWCTTAKTAPFTGVSGNGYFVNTTSGVVTVTLPATPSAGDIISIADYASTFQTNNLTLCNNSSKINGVCATAELSTQGQSVTLVYVDATRGWKNTMDSTSNVSGTPNYIVATGGTITCCGDYKIHTFTSDGCFAVTNAGTPVGSNKISYVVVAGGGGGAGNGSFADASGAGGAGGFREGKCSSDPYSASPLAATPCSALTASVATFPISIGAGGAGGVSNACGVIGSNSIFSTITSTGGGLGAKAGGAAVGGNGGSGGGGGGGGANAGGSGNTPPVSPPQGNNGGAGIPGGTSAGGGGGGATAVGANGAPGCGGNGGTGATSSINASAVARSGGGGGGTYNSPATSGGTGGTGGGGDAGRTPGNPGNNGEAGTANTGGGGGAGATPGPASNGGAGGSGVVILRYKFQN